MVIPLRRLSKKSNSDLGLILPAPISDMVLQSLLQYRTDYISDLLTSSSNNRLGLYSIFEICFLSIGDGPILPDALYFQE